MHVDDDNLFKFEDVEEGVRSPHLVPWLVTGLIAVVAILLAIVVLNLSRGTLNLAPEDAPPVVQEEDTDDESADSTETPTVGADENEDDSNSETDEKPELPVGSDPDDAIDTSGVVIGDVYELDVEWGWDITTEVPNKFSTWTYVIPDGEHLQLQSELIDSLPASCEAQKESWGLERDADGNIKAWSPQQMCEENPALYTELLGLVKHMADTVKPLN